MDWNFKKYDNDDVQRDSSSDKFFKESTGSNSLIREFIQNSLDAGFGSDPVKVVVSEKTLNNKDCKNFLNNLQPHLKACSININEPTIRFIVLEDFNTKGLEGNNKEDFFFKDNITSKMRGGGSHGIGKAVFHDSSKIKTFFGYSIFNSNTEIFLGRTVLRSHGIGSDKYRPDGVLKIPIQENKQFIRTVFTRQHKTGLSIAIPK